MTSAAIKGITYRKTPPISANGRRDVSGYTHGEDKQSEKVLILRSLLGAEFCFTAFYPTAQRLKRRIHGISKDKFLTWLRSANPSEEAWPIKYFLLFVSMVRDQGCNLSRLMNYVCVQ